MLAGELVLIDSFKVLSSSSPWCLHLTLPPPCSPLPYHSPPSSSALRLRWESGKSLNLEKSCFLCPIP